MRVAGAGGIVFRSLSFGNARNLPVQAINANLKFLLQPVEHTAAFERLDGSALRASRPRARHPLMDMSPRIIHEDCDNIFAAA